MSQTLKLLLIDDQAIVAEAMRRLLAEEQELKLSYCQDPAKALETALELQPDLILLDLVMPGSDGLSLVRFFRRHPLLQEIPIIVLSSREDPKKKAEAFESGANDYLVKLPHQIELVARIRAHTRAFLDRQALRESRHSLEESHRELEAANQAKDRFLATMSHEIRTPMNGVLGIAQLLAQTELSEEQRHYVDLILSSGDVLLTLINDILDSSKISAGKMELEQLPFHLETSIEETLSLLSLQASEKGLKLYSTFQSPIPKVFLGDSARLRQILINLVGNALKFTSEGHVEVHLSHNSGGLRIEVRDTGIGIAPEAQSQLFAEFSQADTSTTRKYGGTGLGLAISKGLVEAMGGSLGVDSQPGEGSCFWLLLPLKSQEESAAPHSEEVDQHDIETQPLVDVSGKRILVAEDNLVNQMVTEGFLVEMGFAVELVENGRLALEAAHQGGYDAILMDCEMPEMDGFEATRRIRAELSNPPPIIAMTAYAMEEQRAACLEAGMKTCLTKPVTPETLFSTLQEQLNNVETNDPTKRRNHVTL